MIRFRKIKTEGGSQGGEGKPGNNCNDHIQSLPDLEAESFTNIFNGSPIGVYIVQNRKFRFVNPEFRRIAGFSEKKLLGMESLSIVHPEDRESVIENATKMLKGERTTPFVHRNIDADGELRWIIESVASIRFGGNRATLGYFQDATENERAKEALALSEEKFQKAFRSSPHWFVISTLEDGFYIDVNDAFLEATGYQRNEVIGHTSKELGIWAAEADRDRMVRLLSEKGVVRDLEVQFRMKYGLLRTVLWSAEVIDYGDEKCLIALTRDITARKRAEKEKLQREKLQGVLETAGAACHELNQPLQAIFYLLDEIEEENSGSQAAVNIRKQCQRMREITRKMEGLTTYETTDYIQGAKIIDINKGTGRA